ncbi:DNA repair protein [Aspergillus piperis CBS 112811]|uniref:DNA repair protein n=1 Tax=Aspergillus piperis CBS 112811 TaxID=1448313 RepID=A0A8G1R7Q2_9EURO|nr:DNA repair protein [Aspergillus piperis CBS 112811]RAH59265.1 DNA repair protein [Aspergillus piperis CBS 112811]
MSAPFIPDFPSIGKNIYYYEPDLIDTPIPENANTHPSLIILCSWYGGATPRRVAKYTSGYRQRYPRTSILLINTSFRDYVARSLHSIDGNLTPAKNTITKTLQSTPDARILLHVFSNGGCNTVTQLARAMKSEPVNFKSALKLIIFDCCPGDSSFDRLYAAGAVALPTAQPGRAIGTAVLYSTAKVGYALQSMKAMRSIDDYRADLNDAEIFGEARRLYLYSRIDEMIPWKDVEGHMIEASRRGYSVTGVSFEDGKHCGLVMGDERRYWDAVERAWEGGKTIVWERSRL